MPYKDPERKRNWEREHQAERTTRRRLQRSQHASAPARAESLPAMGKADHGPWWGALLIGAVVLTGLLMGLSTLPVTEFPQNPSA